MDIGAEITTPTGYAFIKKILKLPHMCDIVDLIITRSSSNTADIFFAEIDIIFKNIRTIKKLFIKRSNYKTHSAYHSLSVNEIDFYQRMSEFLEIRSIFPICYFADVSRAAEDTLLILEDLSDNYSLTDDVDGRIADASTHLTKFHAFFWDHKALEYNYQSDIDLKKQFDESEFLVKKFMTEYSALLPRETTEIINKSFMIYKNLLHEKHSRKQNRTNITIINGDSHIYNFMFHKCSYYEPKLIDYQFWEIGISCMDLAHLVRKVSKRHISKAFHHSIMANYYESLISHGVKTYSYEQCYNDYRKCIASLILNPIWQCSKYHVPFEICIQPMDGLKEHFKALDCEKILL